MWSLEAILIPTAPKHLDCMLALHHRATGATVDSDLIKQINGERCLGGLCLSWGERGLAFSGNDELLGSPHNCNFLGILELFSQFDQCRAYDSL